MLRFNANLFRLAFGFSSKEETLYYLQGVYVEPHPQGGVTFTATDGHRLVCIRDEAGEADESAIINLRDGLKQCKLAKLGTRLVTIETGAKEAAIADHSDDPDTKPYPVAMAYDVRVDGTFPDYRRVVPQKFSDKGAPGFRGPYLSDFGDLALELAIHKGDKPSRHSSSTSDSMRVLCEAGDNPEGSPALILFPCFENAFGILMPVRIAADDNKPRVPAWFRAVAPIKQAAE